MKNILVMCLLGLSTLVGGGVSVMAAQTYEASIVGGAPNPSLDYVQQIQKNHVRIIQTVSTDDLTTAAVYHSWKSGVRTLQTVQVTDQAGWTSQEDYMRGLEIAANSSSVVLSGLGPANQTICETMAAHPDVVFLQSVGSQGVREDSRLEPACLSGNILFVSGLDRSLTDLAASQSYGDKVRLAIPYMNLEAPLGGSTPVFFNSKTLGMSMVAGQLTRLQAQKPELNGAALIVHFLQTATVYLPSLEGKVNGARAFTGL